MKDIYTAMQEALGSTSEAMAAKLAERRFVPIIGKIDREKVEGLGKILPVLDLKEVAPITLLISSGGGSIACSRYIGGIIDALHSPVDALVIERAASAAVDIVLMCRKRRALPTSTFFLHFARCTFEATLNSDIITAEDIAIFKKRMTANKRALEELYARRLGKKRAEIHRLFGIGEKYDIDYTASEALKLGIIDEIDTTFKYFEPTKPVP